MADWLETEASISLETDAEKERAKRIIRSASWIVRMHKHFNGTYSAKPHGVRPPTIPWDDLCAELQGDTKGERADARWGEARER